MCPGCLRYRVKSYEVRRELIALDKRNTPVGPNTRVLERAGSSECARTQRLGGIQPSLRRGERMRDCD
jgi:hypothetical protein